MVFDRKRSSGYMTNWAARLFAREMDRRLAPLGLSAAYMPVFFALAAGTALSQKALAQQASVEQPTMAATLKRMERDGLILRRPDPADGRASLVSLTPAAVKKLRLVQAAGHEINGIAMAPLTPAERELYLTLLDKITGALDAG